jgi:hypothetical protein
LGRNAGPTPDAAAAERLFAERDWLLGEEARLRSTLEST